MGRNLAEQLPLSEETKDAEGGDIGDLQPTTSTPISPIPSSRPSSMVVKKANTVIPAHLVAEAISTLHGLDLRWSGPITPSEMQYVQQYVFAKYPEYCNGLVEDTQKIDLYTLCVNEESSETMPKNSPKKSTPPSFGFDRTRLEPSKLFDILTRKSSFHGNFISIPEIQARNRALQRCGLTEDEYLVIFLPTVKEAMIMIGESYPFFRGNYYLTILKEEHDYVREFVGYKDSKVVPAPETWLDLRIKGSQLSQYFRRKCKHSPKGLFSYPASVNETRYSMHWISEAHRSSWHVLLDATGLDPGQDQPLTLALHRPDFVVCMVEDTHSQPSKKIVSLLVRRRSFETVANSP